MKMKSTIFIKIASLIVIVLILLVMVLVYKNDDSAIQKESLSERYLTQNTTIIDSMSESSNEQLTVNSEETESIPEESSTELLTTIGEIEGATTEVKKSDIAADVMASDAVDLRYFDDAVFIGDSRTEALMIFSDLKKSIFYAYKGFSIDKVFEKNVVKSSNGNVTVLDDLKNKSFSKVYLMFGFNETGWIYPEIFIEKYQKLIQAILEINGDAQIYVQSILPVSADYSEQNEFENNSRIDEYNALLSAMATELAKDKPVYFLDVHSALKDEQGALPKDYSFDGVHLKKEYISLWTDYLQRHTVR